MKTPISFLFAFLLALQLNGQKEIGVSFGVGLASIEWLYESENIIMATTTEVHYSRWINENWFVRTGMNYRDRGYCTDLHLTDRNGVLLGVISHKINIRYIGLPFGVFYNAERFYIGLSPELNIYVDEQLKVDDASINSKRRIDEGSFLFGLSGKMGYAVKLDNWSLGGELDVSRLFGESNWPTATFGLVVKYKIDSKPQV